MKPQNGGIKFVKNSFHKAKIFMEKSTETDFDVRKKYLKIKVKVVAIDFGIKNQF